MGREIETSNAVFCYTELKELKGGCKIAAYSPSGRRREKVSDYGKYDLERDDVSGKNMFSLELS